MDENLVRVCRRRLLSAAEPVAEPEFSWDPLWVQIRVHGHLSQRHRLDLDMTRDQAGALNIRGHCGPGLLGDEAKGSCGLGYDLAFLLVRYRIGPEEWLLMGECFDEGNRT